MSDREDDIQTNGGFMRGHESPDMERGRGRSLEDASGGDIEDRVCL